LERDDDDPTAFDKNYMKNRIDRIGTGPCCRAIASRRGPYAAVNTLNNKQRFEKLKFAMRQRRQRSIEELVDYISWGGTAVCVIGHCSKTTGFQGSTPGGPVRTIKRFFSSRSRGK